MEGVLTLASHYFETMGKIRSSKPSMANNLAKNTEDGYLCGLQESPFRLLVNCKGVKGNSNYTEWEKTSR